MSRLLHRKVNRAYPVAVSGEGLYLRGDDQRAYLDACGGAAVSCLGHGHPHVTAAIERQLRAVDYVHTSFFSSEPAERLAEHLIKHAPSGITHVSLVSGGSEAMESALKLARQTAIERGEPQRRHVISRRQSYHGNTLGALAVSGNAVRRKLYDPLLFEAHFIDPCFAFRYAEPGESPEAYGRRAADQLEAKILELGARHRDGFRRRDGGRRHHRCGDGGAGLFPAHTRNLRPLRRAADPRRGHVRHGPHRHAACVRAGGRRPRPHDHRQRARSRRHADRGGAGRRASPGGDCLRLRRLSARLHLYGPSARGGGGPRRPGSDPRRWPFGQRRSPGDRSAQRARPAPRGPPPCRRHPRPRPFPRHRIRGRPRHDGTVRSGPEAPRARPEGRYDGGADGLCHARNDRW